MDNQARITVFKELEINSQLYYLWYKLSDDETNIVPDKILTPIQHKLAMAID